MNSIRRLGRLPAVLLASAMIFSLVTLAPQAASGADGTTLRQIVAQVPSCSIGTGIAFDGENLYLSCWYTNDLYVVDPADGALIDTVSVTGVSGMGALAWDRARSQMWVCTYPSETVALVSINGSTGSAATQFTPAGGCIDGLAYDGGDDSVFTSGDVDSVIYHYDAQGGLLDSRSVAGSLGGCGSSGIAIGGGDLFLANNGCSQIYRVANEQNAVPVLFATYPERLEDLECDDVTFAGQGKAAIWSKDAYDPVLNAFELNAGDCGFGGVGSGDDFVYVALGDSYQSGEGAGNSITDTNRYITEAYEDGSNYPEQVGPQENTYTPGLLPGGNSCHRALANYAKINRDLLEPGSTVTLVDMTCSGATIQPTGGKPPIVGTVGGEVSPESQIRQALGRLEDAGIAPEEVDLVSVGMGGNDAKFGEIVQACVIPNLLRRLIDAYPNPPGEIEFLTGLVASCENFDRFISKTDSAIDTLQPKAEWAQDQLLAEFPNARILQVNYPDILPTGKSAPAWCGGIRKDDLNFAKEKVTRIDAAITASIDATDSARLELVDIEDGFGSNALCPGGDGVPLANGFSEANVEAELTRLLNLNGDGDAVARQKLDKLVREYRDLRACLGNKFNPFDGDCNFGDEKDQVVDAANDLLAYMDTIKDDIFANVYQPPGPDAEPTAVRFDRTRGLFHPNALGFEVMACNVRATYANASAAGCLANPAERFDTVDGVPFWLKPILTFIDRLIAIVVGGFAPNSPIHITFYSEPIDLGVVVADANGEAEFSVRIPDVSPGVHRLQMSGVGSGGVQVIKELKVEIPGDPVPGEGYGVYLCCFEAGIPDDGVIEYVDVSYLGATFTVVPDEEGGIFLELPIPDNSGDVTVTAVSRLTGESIEQTVAVVNPDDLTLAEWGGSFSSPPDWNSVKSGRAVPMNFRVVDGDGEPVDDPAVLALRTSAIDCDTGADLGIAVAADDAGKSGLRSMGNGWWKFNWKTEKGFAGSCRAFSVLIDNGGRHDLWFDFR